MRPTALLTRVLRLPRVKAVRGATTVAHDDGDALRDAVIELIDAIRQDNSFRDDEVISALFTVTPDLISGFPAEAARAAGWHDVPLLCSSEIGVPGALPRCLRVLLHIETHWKVPPRHVYLREARALRPDIVS